MDFINLCKSGRDLEIVKSILDAYGNDPTFCFYLLKMAFNFHQHDVIDLILQNQLINPKGEDGISFYYDHGKDLCELVKIRLDDNTVWYCFVINGKIIKRDGRQFGGRHQDEEIQEKFQQWQYRIGGRKYNEAVENIQ